MDYIIVTRHPGAIEWFQEEYPCMWEAAGAVAHTGNVTADDVRDRVVIGNLPLHLAAEARMVLAIEFTHTPPRGREYTAEDMRIADAHLVSYKIKKTGEIG